MIEASMGSRQMVSIRTVSPNVKWQRAQPVDRSAIASRGELKELLSLIVSHIVVDDLPEPLDDLFILSVAVDIVGSRLKTLIIKVLHAADKQLKFFRLEQ